MVTSTLDYYNSIYMGLPLKSVQKLALSTTARMSSLYQLLIYFWAQFKVQVLIFKGLYGFNPAYPKDCVFPQEPICPLRLFPKPCFKCLHHLRLEKSLLEKGQQNLELPSQRESSVTLYCVKTFFVVYMTLRTIIDPPP